MLQQYLHVTTKRNKNQDKKNSVASGRTWMNLVDNITPATKALIKKFIWT
ncbi:hypothetical protein ES332_A11G176800v1 [Gossypium tomentosum]|uniref:Uncharacterized protein n=1 Tax=Gossypium tomentosum TaxID=34277 RepID=A0A5D2NBQ3_GOSTO|nr:hypothetical protein ES332_A11G176800v1 [Gossypium tomentosum]